MKYLLLPALLLSCAIGVIAQDLPSNAGKQSQPSNATQQGLPSNPTQQGLPSNIAFINPGDGEKEMVKKAAFVRPTAQQLRWQQLELTAFFHFGMNTFTGREWGDGKEDPALFNPTDLDARQWVSAVKAAGIKQVILTCKHHDGFCLWPTKTTGHSVKNSTWKNGQGDVVREVSNACKEEGLGFGVYLSPWDRNSPVYGSEAYNDFFVRQLTELLTQYGRVDEVWFDGANGEGPNGKKQVYDFPRWYKLIRELQPDAVIAIMGPDVRWVGTETGQGREQEWSVVPMKNLDQAEVAAGSQKGLTVKPQGDMRGDDLGSRDRIRDAKGLAWYPAETDVSIRPGWFFHEDQHPKTPAELLDIYFKSVGRNGVLLLNIPPDKRGRISDKDVQALKEWKKLRDRLFNDNLAKRAKISSTSGKDCANLTDNRNDTYFTTPASAARTTGIADRTAGATDSTAAIADTTADILLEFKKPQTFNTLLLQEDIRMGQRVERFVLESFDGGEWVKVTEGTTIGYKRLLQFPSITSPRVRLRILSSRLNPYLAEIGLYFSAQQK